MMRGFASRAMLLLMALLLWQGEAVRIHAAGHRQAEPAPRTAAQFSAPQRDQDHDEAACPLCREDTFFGHYITPDAPELAAVSQYWIVAVPAPPMVRFRAAPITRFRIRGPPVLSA
jgi:hypothetical protein